MNIHDLIAKQIDAIVYWHHIYMAKLAMLLLEWNGTNAGKVVNRILVVLTFSPPATRLHASDASTQSTAYRQDDGDIMTAPPSQVHGWDGWKKESI